MSDTLFDVEPMWRSAEFSADGTYRYELRRVWDQSLPLLGWCALNPSKADAFVDDPSVGRMIAFTKAFGYGGFVLGNMFGFCATNPAELIGAPDPIGPDNDRRLLDVMGGHPVICAWGASVPVYWRHRPAGVAEQLRQRGAQLYHLGLNKDGSPRHPLYLAGDTQRTLWAAS